MALSPLAAGALAALAASVAAFDARSRRVPNRLALAGLAAALACGAGADGAAGMGRAALGAAAGLGVTLPLWLLGWCGAGDCKAAAALCAFLGPGPGVRAALAGLALAGAWAAARLARQGRLRETLAVAAGSVAAGGVPEYGEPHGEGTVPLAAFLALAAALAGLLPVLGVRVPW